MRSILLATAMLLGSGTAFAESYVYLTNSTPNPVRVETTQSGDKALSKGSEWGTYTVEIPAYATRKVLWMNRDQGITNGKYFQFDTTVTQGSSTVVLQQGMRGNLIGSTIWHSAKAADFSEPWQSDRAIHTVGTRYSNQLSVVSYKAEYTGGYDDFHYVIQPNDKLETTSAADEFKVLQWNLWGIIGAKQICDRWAEVPRYARNYDVVTFEEGFDPLCRARLRDSLRAEFPYQTAYVDAPNLKIDGGIFIVSRWPIAREAQHVFDTPCAGYDCLADKGAMYAEIIKNGKSYHVAVAHTQAWNSDEQRKIRLDQVSQMRGLMDSMAPASTDAVLYAGDFNIDSWGFPQDYAEMQARLNATVPQRLGYRYTYDSDVNLLAGEVSREYLDYVMVSNAHKQPRTAENEVMIYRSLSPAVWKLHDLSDHFAVAGRFRY